MKLQTVGSSIVNEVIGVILDFFIIFFYDKISHAQKAQKDAYKQKKLKKTSKKKLLIHLFMSYAFYAHKKCLRRRKSLV